METLSVSHEIHCSADRFWTTFFDPDFNEQLFVQELGFRDYCVLEQKESENGIECRSTGVIESHLATPLRTLTGQEMRYVHQGCFDRSSRCYRWQSVPARMADRLRLEGSMRIEPIGTDCVRRIVEFNVEARIFGIGGLLESKVVKELSAECEVSAAAMNRYFEASH